MWRVSADWAMSNARYITSKLPSFGTPGPSAGSVVGRASSSGFLRPGVRAESAQHRSRGGPVEQRPDGRRVEQRRSAAHHAVQPLDGGAGLGVVVWRSPRCR